MDNNKLIIAAAGSGKTTFLVDKALGITASETILITTYTEANEAQIKKKIIASKGYIPSNITVQTWFSFLLQHGVRPFQSVLNDEIHDADIGFFLTSEKSGKKYKKDGKAVIVYGKPCYWGEDSFKKYYFTNSKKIYSDKISKFIINCNKKSNNQVINRIGRIFNHIFVDEIQDLAGFDLELIKLMFELPNSVLLVGDPRQVTYLTHQSQKYSKYSEGKIKEFILNELGAKIQCQIDEETLNVSHRNNQLICNYSSRLYPNLPTPESCKCPFCRDYSIDDEGIFLVKKSDVDHYLEKYKPKQLRWNNKLKCNESYLTMNFGESKGLTFDRVLIYPTSEMVKWITNNSTNLKNSTRAKLYVGITRAKYSVAFVMDYKDKINYDGLWKYSSNK
ncbi:MAG: UvrD-helicase domain-containing protein, partial [Candidatus Delongbacteria bacterium]|nr:UvrD-helicase domain-containing protein [Candidatus Delongbacteria bacterium]